MKIDIFFLYSHQNIYFKCFYLHKKVKEPFMKKNSIFKCWICLFALLATFALVGCSNDDDNNSGDGSQSTTVLSGKTYTNADSDGEGGVYTNCMGCTAFFCF